MKTFCKSSIALLLFLGSSASIALAQSPNKPNVQGQRPTFPIMDLDKNEQLSREEVANFPRLAAHFDEVDQNKDGTISREELIRYRAERKAERMARKAASVNN